ncbi:DUF935 family protein [Nocardia sp. NPDC057455]|uniref:phage portal protein family protein n=1 Tax=Nocardia sp. NPDC057455 TaxID=3346138 RepID=UPI00366DA006
MAETVSTAPTFELGYVNQYLTDWQQWDQDEKVPDLQWPNSVHVYRRMASEDSRVLSVLEAIGLPILRTEWRIDPNGARDEVTEFVANNLGLPIVGAEAPSSQPRIKGRFQWGEHIETALLKLRDGHQYFEQLYRVGDDGRAYLRKLAPRPSTTITRIHVAQDGGLESIEQRPPVGGKLLYPLTTVEIPVSRLVVYRRKPEPGDWVGRSLLRPAYKNWLLKDEFMRIEAAAARRNGIGVPVMHAPPGADEATIRSYQKMASRYRGGETSGLGLPHDAKAALLGVSGNLPDIRRAIEYHDKSIALVGLAHFLNLDRGGSYALASVQADVFVQSVQSIAESIRRTAQAHVVEDLVDINFGEDEPTPRLVFDEIGSRQDLTASALKILIDAGLILPDPRLDAFVRQQYGMPPAEPDEEPVDDAVQTPAPAAPPAAPVPVPAAARRRASDRQEVLF